MLSKDYQNIFEENLHMVKESGVKPGSLFSMFGNARDYEKFQKMLSKKIPHSNVIENVEDKVLSSLPFGERLKARLLGIKDTGESAIDAYLRKATDKLDAGDLERIADAEKKSTMGRVAAAGLAGTGLGAGGLALMKGGGGKSTAVADKMGLQEETPQYMNPYYTDYPGNAYDYSY